MFIARRRGFFIISQRFLIDLLFQLIYTRAYILFYASKPKRPARLKSMRVSHTRKRGAFTELIDVINNIIEAEHKALAVVGEALRKKEALPETVAEETRRLRKKYADKADKKIAEFRDAENKKTEAELKKIDLAYAEKFRELDDQYKKMRGQWVKRLYDRAIRL